MRTSYNVLFEEKSIVVTLAVFCENSRDREVLDEIAAMLDGRQQIAAAMDCLALALNGRGCTRIVAALNDIRLNYGRWQLEYGEPVIGKPIERAISPGKKACYFPIRFGKSISGRA